MKKYSKLFIFTLLAFFISSVSVLAREMGIDELGEEASKIQPDAGYVYILGEYAFTSNYNIHQEDLIIAATSLKLENPTDLSQAVIYQIERKRDENYNPIGWKKGPNVLGKKTIPETFNIKWIDMHHILEKSKAEVNLDISNSEFSTYTKILKDKLKFDFAKVYGNGQLTYTNGKVSGLLLQNTEISLSEADKTKFKNPKYFFAYVLEIPNATKETTITTSGMNRTGELKWESFDVKEAGNTPGIVVLVPVNPEDWQKDPNYTITIDLDGDKVDKDDEYGKTEYKLDLSGLKFQQDSKATLNTDENNISQADKESLTNWGYNLIGENKHYNLSGSENSYKLTGKVEKQNLKENTFSTKAEEGYFFVFNLKKPDDLDKVPEGVKVTVKGQETLTYGKNYFNNDGVFTEIFKLKDKCEEKNSCKIEITVDWDDEGQEYLESQKITIDYSELTFVKSSKFSVQSVDEVKDAETKLGTDFGWKKPDNYSVKLNTEDSTVKVTGLLPILDTFTNEKHPFNNEDTTGYYLPFVIKTDAGKKDDNTNVTVQFIHEGENSKTFTAENFDGDDILYILRHLDKDATDKTFKIVVDMDGNGEEYSPYEITFDWSELKLQEKSTTIPTLGKASETDKQTMTSFGYVDSKNENLTLVQDEDVKNANTYKLTGKMKEQILNDQAFGKEQATGYFFNFTFVKPEGVKNNNAKIESLNDASGTGEAKKVFKQTEYDAEGNLTILKRFDPETSCKPGDNCKLYYRVDWDGDGNEYLPTIYTIDYSNVTFEKSSLFEVKALNSNDDNTFEDEGWLNKKGYSIKVEQDKNTPNKYKVSGILPIYTDDEWNKDDDPLKSTENDYYLGLILKLLNAPEGFTDEDNKMSIKFLDSDGEDKNYVTAPDFGTSQSLYILKYLVPSDENKEFKIIVDLDGDLEEYAPYEVTINYTDLEFQNESSGVDFDILNVENLDENSAEKKELEDYKFNSDTIKEVLIKEEQNSGLDKDSTKIGLQGKIKEQTLAKGFVNNTGYFVPIKIAVPKDGNWFTKHQKDWTITLNTEKDGKKTYTPTSEEYEQGWVMVLFRLDENKKEIKYEIDFDGKDDAFLPTEYIIKYNDLNFQTENKITFEYFDEKTGVINKEEKIVYQGEKFDDSITPKLEDYTFHDFDYWYNTTDDSENKFDFSNATTGKNEDITLKAHWTIDVDSFLVAVINDLKDPKSSISEDFSNIFEISKTDDTITFKVINATALLSDMNRTSIPGTIAYLLQRGEIKDITLTFGEKKIVFTKDGTNDQIQLANLDATGSALKEKIQAGAKALFQDVLSEDESTMTLNKMAVDDRDFKITIGELDDSVQLKEGAKTSYTFDFITDVTGVKSEAELTAALKNKLIKHIDITGNFAVENPIEVTRDVVINGGSSKYTITAGSGVNTIFTTKNSNVTIENVKLNNAKIPIIVESGNLKTTELTVEGENTETAVEVKNGASLEISKLTYKGEKYTNPAVKAEKTNATVKFTDSEEKNAVKLETMEKITKYEDLAEPREGYGDKKEAISGYNYYNYYNNAENSKIYKTTFHNHEGRKMATFERYNYSGEIVEKPYDEGYFDVFKSFDYNAETYTLIGYAESRNNTVNFNYSGDVLPQGVIDGNNIKATSDKYYYAAYSVKLRDGVTKVQNAKALKDAIDNPKISEIYIDTTEEIDLSGEDINISRKLSIVGPSVKVKVKVKSIKVTADNVFLHRLNLEFTPDEGTNELINISGDASKFTLWQCSLKNNGSQNVKDAIKYSGTKATIDVRWNTFYSDKIDNTMLNVDTALAGVTDIYGNTFKKLSVDNSKKSAIKIKNFDTTARMNDDDETIRIAANTFDREDYAIEISKYASAGNQADISLETSQDIDIAVRYDDSHENFENIKFHHSEDTNKINIKYIDENGKISDTLDDGAEIEIVVPIGMQGLKVPEQAIIKGLKLNGDTYSGIINQSKDGKFYLPVTLTSNDFEDRVSTVRVTDPNGNVKNYLYGSNSNDGIATVSNIKTMNLQLEAIKSSKITGNNGKVYKLELDADGDKSNAYEVKEYTINYSDVETLEEKINNAAENTLKANSFTVTKNNKINGYTEEFTYKYNKNEGLTYLKSNKGDKVEEYTFSVKYAGVSDSTSKLSVVTRKKIENIEDSGIYLNDWVYVHPQQVGSAIHEITMLTDVMGNTYINAIDKVKLNDEKAHTYIVTLNRDKYNDWVNKNYLSNSNYTSAEWALNETVTVEVELDDNDQYIKSIKTSQNSSNNTFDVTFENVNKTTLEVPTKFFSTNGETLKDEDIKSFYENGKKWWDKHIYEDAYKQQ